MTANENHHPFRASGITFFSYGLPFVLITASQSGVLFAHRRLPMGKKKPLRPLCLGGEISY